MFSGATFETTATSPPAGIPDDPIVRACLLETLLVDSRDATLVVEAPAPDLGSLRIVYANSACLRAGLRDPSYGRTLIQALDAFREALSHPALLGRVRSSLVAGVPLRGESLAGECKGQSRLVLLDISPLPAPASSCTLPLWLVTLRDVAPPDHTHLLLAQTERLLTEAVERADRDPLTGLLNHRAFHKRLEQEAEAARRSGRPLAVAMMDVDNFRFFNDGYGHSVGDDLLRRVGQALAAACRPGDTLARYGGDEFALLLPGLGAEGAVRLADRLVASLAGAGYKPAGYDAVIPLTLSIGIAVFPDDGPKRLDTLAAADARLARVKTGGTGRGDLTDRLRALLPCAPSDFSMLNALVTAVDAKDRYTRRHSEDVMTYSLQIAQEMSLEEKEQEAMLLAALLHDVGKIGVPDHILRKPGRLTEEEFEAIKQHPMMGAIIIGAMPGFEAALDAVRHHHERWDGRGYPFGLIGEGTPLPARIMAVADAFSAMTTDRPYRKGMEAGCALQILEDGAGTQWDPACVAAFTASCRKQDGLLGEA